MSVLPFLGIPLHWPPALLALTALIIAPGAHLLLSPLLEGRRVTWRDDYAAVLIGDPLLAVAVGFAASLSRPAGPMASRPPGLVAAPGSQEAGRSGSGNLTTNSLPAVTPAPRPSAPPSYGTSSSFIPCSATGSPPPNGQPTELSGPLRPPRESSRPRWSSPPRERGPS